MNYYFSDVIKGTKDAGFKARIDIETILSENGYKRLANSEINPSKKGLKEHFNRAIGWINATKNLKENDNVIIQFPLAFRTIFFKKVLKSLKENRVNIIFIVHDLDMLRARSVKSKIRIFFEENNILNFANSIIVHNQSMKQYMISKGIKKDKLISLEIFDYLIQGNEFSRKIHYGKELIVAGSLRNYKVGYLYKGPKKLQFNLYGVGYTGKFDNQHFYGAFDPDELPFVLQGSYGLVWDGDSVDTCSGSYGKYLMINNPHKSSLYLASGVPVIIWKQAALADFIVNNHLGIAVDSLNDVNDVLRGISKEEYEEMRKNVLEISSKLRNGYFTMKAINKALEN